MKRDKSMLTDKFLAKELNVRPKLIRDTIETIVENYNLDRALVVKDKTKSGSPKWFIHESLRKDLATEIMPNFSFVRSTKSSFGSKKPGLDIYDGNYH